MLDSKQFEANLKRALGDMKQGAVKGIRLATAYVKLEAQKLTPVDEGNLKASAYTSVSIGSYGVVGEIGFTAEYAAWVHEMPMVNEGTARHDRWVDGHYIQGKGDYWDPQGQATNKFLEKAFYNNKAIVLEIIQKAASL